MDHYMTTKRKPRGLHTKTLTTRYREVKKENQKLLFLRVETESVCKMSFQRLFIMKRRTMLVRRFKEMRGKVLYDTNTSRPVGFISVKSKAKFYQLLFYIHNYAYTFKGDQRTILRQQ
ncbi:uncharacterized protein SOCG_06137 [Schizosaccharomyces octosporus yFS286]|uniref:Uncharacterized protein n=1 Tax=Schizosaccharomyces octosporus (strain yFS286) TaxID=483514 RepID=S9PR37_SCHOY|nr:uncharacterized protein SOCG_06137 [Schizosaccharomyces octosporus yFS286]EPX71616.1 hypothetical protein SOCG_06137 [Schizosaccharomyces octosporus yFS286]